MDRDVKQNIAENAPIENPPEGGAGRDPLQDLSPEACTFEVFQQLNSKTASVLVTHDFADGTRRFSAGVTDESGVFGDILLPAPNNALAQSPTGEMPYALYDIRVSHPGCRTEIYRAVPVFPGVTSIQPVQFLAVGER